MKTAAGVEETLHNDVSLLPSLHFVLYVSAEGKTRRKGARSSSRSAHYLTKSFASHQIIDIFTAIYGLIADSKSLRSKFAL